MKLGYKGAETRMSGRREFQAKMTLDDKKRVLVLLSGI